MSVRISATDWVEGGFDGDDAVAFARRLVEAGCDIVDVSTGQVSPDQKPAYGRSYQTPYADRIRHEAGIPVIAVGAISSYDDVNTIILAGRADLCALARPHLWDPHWTLHAAADQGVDMPGSRSTGRGSRAPQHRQGRAPDAAAPLRRGPRVSARSSSRAASAGSARRSRAAFAGENVVAAVQRRPRRDRRGRRRARASASSGRSTCSSTTPASPRARRCQAHDARPSGSASSRSTPPARSCARARSLEGMLRARPRADRHRRLGGQRTHGSRYTSGYTASKHAVLGLDARGGGRGGRHRRDRQRGLPGVRALAT